jgi:hypothetical protein
MSMINPVGYSGYSNYGVGSSGSASATPETKDISFSGSSATRQSSSSSAEPKKSGGIGGFFKGIVKGAVNAVKSLATPKGLLMAAAGIAACVAFPVAAPLILGGVAVAAGGSKIYQGVKSGDTEKIGEGVFTAGAGVAGAVGTGAVGSVLSRSKGAGAGATAEAGAATEAGANTAETGAITTEAGAATEAGTTAEAGAATEAGAASTEAGTTTTAAKTKNFFAGGWNNLKNSKAGQNLADAGSTMKNGEGFKAKLAPLAKPAMMLPATGSLTAPPSQQDTPAA